MALGLTLTFAEPITATVQMLVAEGERDRL